MDECSFLSAVVILLGLVSNYGLVETNNCNQYLASWSQRSGKFEKLTDLFKISSKMPINDQVKITNQNQLVILPW